MDSDYTKVVITLLFYFRKLRRRSNVLRSLFFMLVSSIWAGNFLLHLLLLPSLSVLLLFFRFSFSSSFLSSSFSFFLSSSSSSSSFLSSPAPLTIYLSTAADMQWKWRGACSETPGGETPYITSQYNVCIGKTPYTPPSTMYVSGGNPLCYSVQWCNGKPPYIAHNTMYVVGKTPWVVCWLE